MIKFNSLNFFKGHAFIILSRNFVIYLVLIFVETVRYMSFKFLKRESSYSSTVCWKIIIFPLKSICMILENGWVYVCIFLYIPVCLRWYISAASLFFFIHLYILMLIAHQLLKAGLLINYINFLLYQNELDIYKNPSLHFSWDGIESIDQIKKKWHLNSI